MTNVSIPEVICLKNSLTLSVSVLINLYIKLGFVFVNDHKETYFVDMPRSTVGLTMSGTHRTVGPNPKKLAKSLKIKFEFREFPVVG